MTHLFYRLAQGITIDPDDPRLDNVPKPPGGLGQTDVAAILQIVFGVAGGVALIVIVIAGMRFVTSMGDPQSTMRARNTIIYTAIGLVVCIMAFAIVRLTIGQTT